MSLLTAQHYKRTACALGLRDTESGAVFLEKDLHLAASAPKVHGTKPLIVNTHPQPRAKLLLMRKREQSMPHCVSAENLTTTAAAAPISPIAAVTGPTRAHKDCRLLSLEQDRYHLNGIHCWVRQHIEAFAASEKDVLVPSPGRKQRILVGQVGLRCVHCADSNIRVKRAVCYPPSISGIYHSVSNMKFDHFKQCPCLPLEDRIEFEALLEAARTKASAGKGSSNSTAKYYKTASRDIGLVDSNDGIRFQERSNQQPEPGEAEPTSSTESADDGSMDGISALVMAATNPELQAEFTRRKMSIQTVAC